MTCSLSFYLNVYICIGYAFVCVYIWVFENNRRGEYSLDVLPHDILRRKEMKYIILPIKFLTCK